MRMRSGFTLVELAIVVVYIIIIASILLPIFATVKDPSRVGMCRNNEKQIGLAVLSYLQDFDQTYPIQDSAGHGAWGRNANAYIKSAGVWHCPDDSGAIREVQSYAANVTGDKPRNGGAPYSLWGRSVVNIRTPENCILFGEQHGAPFLGSDWIAEKDSSLVFNYGSTTVHNGSTGANYGFADGHVKFFRQSEIAPAGHPSPEVPDPWDPRA